MRMRMRMMTTRENNSNDKNKTKEEEEEYEEDKEEEEEGKKNTRTMTLLKVGSRLKNASSIDEILPTDALLHVISFLPNGADVFKFACTNKKLYRMLVENDREDEKIWKRLCKKQEDTFSLGGRNGRAREDLVVGLENINYGRRGRRQSQSQSQSQQQRRGRGLLGRETKPSASFSQSAREDEKKLSKGWRKRRRNRAAFMALAAKEKKRNEEEEEEEREENFFKWRDLYAWRRRVLFSARRAREQEDEERRASLESSASLEEDEEKEWTQSMSTSTSWMSTHLKYRLAVCDDKSVFTCDPREDGGRIRMLHETTMNRFVFTSLTWSNNGELLSVLMQSLKGYSVLCAAPHESNFWRAKMKCDLSTMAKLSREDDLDDDGDSGGKNKKGLKIIDEEEKENEEKRRKLAGDVLSALDDSADEGRVLDGEEEKEAEEYDADMDVNSEKAAEEEEEEAEAFPLSKKIFDIYESEEEEEEEKEEDDERNEGGDDEGCKKKRKTTKHTSFLLQTASGKKRGEKNDTSTKKRKTIYEKKEKKEVTIKLPSSPPPLVNCIVLPTTMVPFGIQFAPCGTKLAIVAKEKAIVPQVQAQQQPTVSAVPVPLPQPAIGAAEAAIANDGNNDDNPPAAAELDEVGGEVNAQAAVAETVAGAPNQNNVGVQTMENQQQQQQNTVDPPPQVPEMQMPQGRDVSLSMLDLVQTMNSLYGFANNGLKFPRASHPGGREIVQKIEQKDASMFFSFAPDNSGDMIGISKKLSALRLIENATNLPISRGKKKKSLFPEDELDAYHRGNGDYHRHHHDTSTPVPLSFQQHYINSNKRSMSEEGQRRGDMMALDDDEVDLNELNVMNEHARMLHSWEQREAEVISGFLKYPLWNRTKKFVCTVANHSLTPAISKLTSFVTESGQRLIQVCRQPVLQLRLKRKRGMRMMNDSDNEEFNDDDSFRSLSSDQHDGRQHDDRAGGYTNRRVIPSQINKFSSLSSKQLYEQEMMSLKETTRVPLARSESKARFCKKKDVLWQIGRGHVPITHHVHWIPGKRNTQNQMTAASSRGHWLVPFTLPDSFPPITYMMLIPAPPSSLSSSSKSTATTELEVGERETFLDDDGEEEGEEEPLNVDNYIKDVIAKHQQNQLFDQLSKERELGAKRDISKFEKLIVCEVQPSSVFVEPDVTVPFVLAARPGGEHVAWADERAVYLRRTDPVKGGPISDAVKILDLNACTFSTRDEYNTEFMTYEAYGQGLAGDQPLNAIVEPILYYVVALKWSNSGDRLLICLCTVFSGASTYCVYQWVTWDPPGAFFYKEEDFPFEDICNTLLDDSASALEVDENGRIEDCATITIGSYFFPSRQFKENVLLVDGGLKQIWSPNEDAIVFPVMLSIKKSPLPTYTTSTQTNATQQQQQQQQQNTFVDFIVIQEFPLASKKTTSSDEKNNRTNKKKGNNIRNSKQQQQKQQQHHEKEERLRTYQIDNEIAIPFRARFLPKKHKGKNFIRVCEGKFCAWSQ